MADKPTNRERLQQITAGIEQGIKDCSRAKVYALPVRNVPVPPLLRQQHMLIYMQKPDATLVAGYNKWKNQFERM